MYGRALCVWVTCLSIAPEHHEPSHTEQVRTAERIERVRGNKYDNKSKNAWIFTSLCHDYLFIVHNGRCEYCVVYVYGFIHLVAPGIQEFWYERNITQKRSNKIMTEILHAPKSETKKNEKKSNQQRKMCCFSLELSTHLQMCIVNTFTEDAWFRALSIRQLILWCFS